MKSVGIPAYNEEKSIKNTISSLLPQINPQDEIIVVASGCTDKTVDIVNNFSDTRVKLVIQKKRKGKVSAINKILENAEGDIIILADADVSIPKDAVSKLINNFKNPKVGATCARVANFQRKTLFDKIQGFGWFALDHQKRKEDKEGTFYALNGYLVAIRNDIINKLDESFLLDDALLGWEIKKKGYEVIYESDACAYVKAAQSLSDYIAQKSRNRVGWWQMTKKGMKIKERRNAKQLKYLFTNLYSWPYISLDFLIWLKAFIDFRKNKSYWKEIKSSKI